MFNGGCFLWEVLGLSLNSLYYFGLMLDALCGVRKDNGEEVDLIQCFQENLVACG